MGFIFDELVARRIGGRVLRNSASALLQLRVSAIRTNFLLPHDI